MQRINAEQAAIERRLVELGVDDIQKKLRDTTLQEGDTMHVDNQQGPEPRPISAKQRALAKYVRTSLALPCSFLMRRHCFIVCAHTRVEYE